jgi:hypothetical protein
MPTTADLIDRLATAARPVRRLAPPTVRALLWLAVAATFVGVAASIAGIRPGLAAEFDDPRFAIGRGAALATAITAALASFQLSVPDRSARWLWLPLPFAALWLGAMGVGCIADWLAEGPQGLTLGHSADCFVAILTTSVPLGALLLVMVRHAGPVRPVATALAAGLALAAVGEGGLTLYHDVDASLMDLLIHLAAIAVVIALALSGSRALYRAVAPR